MIQPFYILQTNFRTDKLLQIKLETFDEDDMSADNEKEGLNKVREKPRRTKRSRRKIKEELVEFDEDDFDEDSVDVKKKRRRFLPQNSGPPFDCRSCKTSFDIYSTYRYILNLLLKPICCVAIVQDQTIHTASGLHYYFVNFKMWFMSCPNAKTAPLYSRVPLTRTVNESLSS